MINVFLLSLSRSIENQFFVTSTQTRGTVIENKIGEALVSRIIRAHREQTPWRAVIVIPLIPGFPMPIDHPDAASVRLIVELQNRSICRGEDSIFAKLRREGIDPDDYITFFSLRQWGRLPSGQLTTEQVYIHAKAMVVDDRLALIGSANINERSQRGDRDSELACVVRDTDMIDGTMAGKPFKVGRFAHTLRVRLMREHLGVDVDGIDAEAVELEDVKPDKMLDEDDDWDPAGEQRKGNDPSSGRTTVHPRKQVNNLGRTVAEFVGPVGSGAGKEAKQELTDKNPITHVAGKLSSTGPSDRREEGGEKEEGESAEAMSYAQPVPERIERIVDGEEQNKGSESTVVPTMEERLITEQHRADDDTHTPRSSTAPHSASSKHMANGDTTSSSGAEELKKTMSNKMSINPWALPATTPTIEDDMFEDPLDDRFFKDMWMASAVHNTQIYRKVFKCVPDDTVTTWAEYKAFNAWSERLAKSGVGSAKENKAEREQAASKAGNVNARGATTGAASNSPQAKSENLDQSLEEEAAGAGAGAGGSRKANGGDGSQSAHTSGAGLTLSDSGRSRKGSNEREDGSSHLPPASASETTAFSKGGITRPPANDEGFSAKELDQMEALLEETRGTLVLHCTRFLEAEGKCSY